MAETKKTDVEVAMEEAAAEEAARGPQEVEVAELSPEQADAVTEWKDRIVVLDPSGPGEFARSDQHPSFEAAAFAAPAEEPVAAAAKK